MQAMQANRVALAVVVVVVVQNAFRIRTPLLWLMIPVLLSGLILGIEAAALRVIPLNAVIPQEIRVIQAKLLLFFVLILLAAQAVMAALLGMMVRRGHLLIHVVQM
jgi:hypothetical protein